MAFIQTSEWGNILSARGLKEEVARYAIEARLLPSYVEQGTELVWDADLIAVPESWSTEFAPGKLPLGDRFDPLGVDLQQWTRLRFANGVEVILPPLRLTRSIPALGPALRMLARERTGTTLNEKVEVKWIGGVRIVLPNRNLLRVAEVQLERINRISADRASELTKSAYYMGSKYSLSSFLVESVASVLPESGAVVDLMCGAGSAARAFSLNWEVLACDAMSFCTTLASSFGRKAEGEDAIFRFLPRLRAAFRQNLESLEAVVGELATEEDALLHSPLGFESGLAEKYIEFTEHTPRYPDGGCNNGWCPTDEILKRKEPGCASLEPYCLTLSYFGNVYFGFRQAMELDSIRFAIDHLPDVEDRQFALAALVATASYIGTGYASQFAQPVHLSRLSHHRLSALLERRSIRVFPEFVARLTALAGVAAKSSCPITAFTGPWEEAVKHIRAFTRKRQACVYIDAPYTRDEYARYYHVLETLCQYHYPDSIGRGRVPNRKAGQVFQSQFFTRKTSAIGPLLADIIIESLRHAEYCAWSYSSRARASIPAVVRSVIDRGATLVQSFSFAHKYSGQGRSDRRVTSSTDVDEYLLIFHRNEIALADWEISD